MLWEWHFADKDVKPRLITESQLAVMLSYWFPFSDIEFTRKRGTWCDGIPLLQVSKVDRTTFAMIGVGYFPYQLSPFELYFHYKHRRDLATTKIELRFGVPDSMGNLAHGGRSPEGVLLRRPREIEQWAVAVELEPTS